MKFATKSIRQCPPHLMHFVTLPWEIKKTQILCRYSAVMTEMQKNCILIASNFVIHPQILIFWCLK